MELVQELKSRGLHMDGIIYGTLLSVCASNNRCKEAEKYFDEMKSDGHAPNVFHYSSLLNAYAVDGNYKKAEELIQEMKTAGLACNKVGLLLLLPINNLSNCIDFGLLMCKFFNLADIKSLKCQSYKVVCVSILLKHMVFSFALIRIETKNPCKTGTHFHLLHLQVVLTTLLKVYVKGGMFEKSRELLDEMQALGYTDDEVKMHLIMIFMICHCDLPPHNLFYICCTRTCLHGGDFASV